MEDKWMALIRDLLLGTLYVALIGGTCAAGQRGFTVSDDIALSRFGDLLGKADPIIFSPDGKFVVVASQRGLLKQNRCESTLRLYRLADVHQFLLHPENESVPSPIWTFSRSTFKDGPIITEIQWLSDSRSLAFLAKTVSGNNQLLLADPQGGTVNALTPPHWDVSAFDIHDRSHFIYSVNKQESDTQLNSGTADSIVGTGRDLFSLLSPGVESHTITQLWAVENGRDFRVAVKGLYANKLKSLKMSPDCKSAIAALALKVVPAKWESLYPPPSVTSAYGIHSGVQDLDSWDGYNYVSQYARIDLSSGRVTSIVNAPIGLQAGWWATYEAADWSSDGSSVLLSNTFLPHDSLAADGEISAPCIAIVQLKSGHASCIEYLPKEGTSDFYYITGARFLRGVSSRVDIVHQDPTTFSESTVTFERADTGEWRKASQSSEPAVQTRAVDVKVKESFKDPPVLIATDKPSGASRVILNLNPQLSSIELARTSLFTWRDPSGHYWTGGLFRPPDYVDGKRYPLVIQTHGFTEQEFRPFGTFPSAGAAQELAASGIVVLQTPDCPMTIDQEEGPCNVGQYESAIRRLVDDGVVDPGHVGIVGFSRTCYYVLDALTTSQLQFRAASITDGVNEGYLQYLMTVDYNPSVEQEADAIIGGRPFGKGLENWLERSPTFNLDRVTAPLQIVAIGRVPSLLSMWEPYSALRLLGKPVDLILISNGTHVLTSPADRVVSQGGTVDWFRFWLQGYEDPDPAKSEQYARWRNMRDHHQ